MKKILAILLIVVFTACNNNGVTEKEVQSVKKVLDFYGGVCNRIKGFSITNGVKEKYFELEMSKSELIESYSNMLEMPASNVAYLFYSNLGSEQSKYNQIKVKINLNNGKSFESAYPAAEIKEVENFIPVLNDVSLKIKLKDYKGLMLLFDTNLVSGLNENQLKSYCSPSDSAYGKIKETQFQGYAFFKSETDKREMVHLAGILVRQNNNTPISLFIDRKSKKILTMKFKF